MHSPQNGVFPETIGTMPSTIQRIHQTTILLRHRLESAKSANGRIQARSSSIRRSAISFWSPMHRSDNWNHFLESLVHILVSPTVGYQLLVSQALIQLLESFSGISRGS